MVTFKGTIVLALMALSFFFPSEAQPQRGCCQVPPFGRNECCYRNPGDRCCGRGGHPTPPPPIQFHCCNSTDVKHCCATGPLEAIDDCCRHTDDLFKCSLAMDTVPLANCCQAARG
ncbi:hypothetical protein KC19_6G081700 [Ceratodon purpureus]|uniref:Uncharacterized protein n=1 Tax=Ceratodon purpureus TaxID=3225 RepID=A0A8T0HG78_CERPU|nr:hypothetical protein KC19_6G081700 [Ceratodon purpureus]